jgi:hypothetical protein
LPPLSISCEQVDILVEKMRLAMPVQKELVG